MDFSQEKKLMVFRSFFILGIVFMCIWGFKSYGQDKHDHSKMMHKKTNVSKKMKNSRKPLAEGTKKSVILALEANEDLHQSFFKYDSERVEANAQKLSKAIDAIEDKEISRLLSYSKSKLSEIKKSNERDLNNKNYHLVSMALIYIVNQYDIGSGYNAYSCPMVKKKWIQNSTKLSKVHNPYAPMMPHCGSQDTNF